MRRKNNLHIVQSNAAQLAGRLFMLFPERHDASARLSSYCICPPGFTPPSPDQLWKKVHVSPDLLDVHPIFRRLGWHFLRPNEDDNPVIRFACDPYYTERIAFLIEELLRPGFPSPDNLPPQSYYLPSIPPEILNSSCVYAEKLARVDWAMQVPVDFEVQFLWTLQLAIEAAIAKGIWTFWDGN